MKLSEAYENSILKIGTRAVSVKNSKKTQDSETSNKC